MQLALVKFPNTDLNNELLFINSKREVVLAKHCGGYTIQTYLTGLPGGLLGVLKKKLGPYFGK